MLKTLNFTFAEYLAKLPFGAVEDRKITESAISIFKLYQIVPTAGNLGMAKLMIEHPKDSLNVRGVQVQGIGHVWDCVVTETVLVANKNHFRSMQILDHFGIGKKLIPGRTVWESIEHDLAIQSKLCHIFSVLAKD